MLCLALPDDLFDVLATRGLKPFAERWVLEATVEPSRRLTGPALLHATVTIRVAAEISLTRRNAITRQQLARALDAVLQAEQLSQIS